jgi:hypothetical protein
MKIIQLILLGMLILPEYIPIRKTDAFPLLDNITTTQKPHLLEPHQLNVVTAVGGRTPLVCDACMFLANGLNQTVLHNPKVIAFVTEDLEQICAVLPQSVQALCSAAANQTAPIILGHLGDFIATNGCADLGVCHGVV